MKRTRSTKIDQRFYGKRVEFDIPIKHLEILKRLEESHGIVPAEFVREAVADAIETISGQLPNLYSCPEEARYMRLYRFWMLKNGLKPNTRKINLDVDLSETAINAHGFETLYEAINLYSKILKSSLHIFVPLVGFEEFLQEHLKNFLPSAEIPAWERYKRPRMEPSPSVLANRLTEYQQNTLDRMNNARKKEGLRALTGAEFKERGLHKERK